MPQKYLPRTPYGISKKTLVPQNFVSVSIVIIPTFILLLLLIAIFCPKSAVFQHTPIFPYRQVHPLDVTDVVESSSDRKFDVD